ncbi:MAG: dUTP diphosphatase [Alphaproteobacteria bacterium]|jgi:dUTP pyrophosphatase|nr:dUTP diphosphatase [Alphaproteobacteria bacterium]
MTLTVPIIRLPHARDLPLPAYATAQAAGLDLLAALAAEQSLAPGARLAVPTGIALALPPGYEGQVRPRSGLALSAGLTVLNSPGTIDADYRGEVMVLLINLGSEPAAIRRGLRIAQLVVAPCCTVRWEDRGSDLEASPRGAGGFGSTGLGTD